ncbi:two-component system histidine kinase PnpS [Candidatus Contubernalis alkaliaceticus]|uniref:two-component system histidine kinase PnpS n=1 Tax=Candidatus Contubernalis alkaliaceticus TaxID=338645 RepID=UPI001F4C1CB6|nr:ATP-binding protein [Candidatus Contubernalis alkalaceticus]UNC90881.1 HAMP domain-containing protein [Candidatus Contubernalis alkalaceticus]
MLKSLRGKFILTYLVLISIVVIVLGIYLLSLFEQNYHKTLRNNLHHQGILAAAVSKDSFDSTDPVAKMEELSEKIAEDIKVRVTIIDYQGVVLGDSEELAVEMENHINRPELVRAIQEGVGFSSRFSITTNQDFFYAAVPVYSNGQLLGFVRLSLPMTELNQARITIWTAVILSLLLALIISVWVSVKYAKNITVPLEEIAITAQNIARGNFDQTIDIKGEDEIGQLGAAFNHMAQTLKEKVQEIVRSKSQLESFLSSMVIGIILLDREGKIILSNPAAEAIISFSQEEVVGKSHLSVLRDYQLSEKVESVLKTGKTQRLEIVLNFPYEKILEVNLAPVKDVQEKVIGLVIAIHDITEIRRLEKVRSEFIANATHELRTPVTSVKGFAETLLEQETLEDPQLVREFLEIIEREAERLNRLINDLLELTKIEYDGLVKFVPVDVKGLIEETSKKLELQIKKKTLKLCLDLPDSPVHVLGDEDKIHQVLLNLLDNSMKYTPEGGSIKVTLLEKVKEILVVVEDTGIGIPREEISRIFERFYRVDKARSRKMGGTGLGLAIVKHIIETHHGRIWVESNLTQGSRFYFTLPKRTS